MGSSKPCPGCGRVHPRRKSTEVCMHCRDKLRAHDYLKEELRKLTEDKRLIKLASLSSYQERIGLPVRRLRADDRDYSVELMEVLWELANAIATPIVDQEDRYGLAHTALDPLVLRSDGYTGAMFYKMNKEAAKKLHELRQLLPEIAKACYDAGWRDGQALLVNVAEGKASINDYEIEVKR